jgi:hypothetical protein
MPGESGDALSLEASWPLFESMGRCPSLNRILRHPASHRSNPDRALWSRFDDVVLAV